MPLPAEGFAARFVLGPALRTQPDRRLVTLVRDGYETAFEEIVRRYGKPLSRYAAAIVGARGEDVTQDAFSKALLALRRDDAEIELRPWLFRIVRNTALNELRDSPPSPEALAEAIAGGSNPAEELERREELADLMRRLQSLPEPQRAAIVMRELEGLSHEEIAAALGLSGGAARQAIYRARRALRDGLGMLLPLPLLRTLIDHGGEAAAVGAGASGAAAASGAVSGAGMALKAGVVTAVLAGSVGTGVALHDRGRGNADASATSAARTTAGASTALAPAPPLARATIGSGSDLADNRHGDGGPADDGSGRGGDNHDRLASQQAFAPDDDGGDPGPSSPDSGRRGHSGLNPADDDRGGSHGPHRGGRGEDGGGSHSGAGPGSSGPDNGGRDDNRGGKSGAGPGAVEGESGRHGSDGDDSGSSGQPPQPPPPEEEGLREEDRSGSGSGSGGSRSGSSSGPSGGRESGGEELP